MISTLPRPHPIIPQPKAMRLPKGKRMTIPIHMLGGNFSLLTAADTQETYSTGQIAQVGKISSYGRSTNPPRAMNIASAGDPLYATALTQDIGRFFMNFSGTLSEFEERARSIIRDFYTVNVLPLVGKVQDESTLNYSLLLTTKHAGTVKLWRAERMLLVESLPFECIGIGKPTAESSLNRFYPRYPTFESCAILVAYIIYRVKSTGNIKRDELRRRKRAPSRG
jgi:hypothetical protein